MSEKIWEKHIRAARAIEQLASQEKDKRIAELEAKMEKYECLLAAARDVVAWDWRDNDGDCVADIRALENSLNALQSTAPVSQTCNYPLCQSEAEQEKIAADVHRQLYTGQQNIADPQSPHSERQEQKEMGALEWFFRRKPQTAKQQETHQLSQEQVIDGCRKFFIASARAFGDKAFADYCERYYSVDVIAASCELQSKPKQSTGSEG